MILPGRPISRGVARGTARVVDPRTMLDEALAIASSGDPRVETERLRAALGRAVVELERLRRQLAERVGPSEVAIFESHGALMHDPKFLAHVEREITQQGRAAEAAVAVVINRLYAGFIAHPVPLLQDKAADLLDIGRRLIRCLSSPVAAEALPERGQVVVAASLTPSQLVRYARHGVVAAVTETCGARSHTAILARGLALPFLTGVPAQGTIPNHARLIVDADRGQVLLNPTEEERQPYAHLFDQASAPRVEPPPPVHAPLTSDGARIQVLLNISDPLEAAAVGALGADGIGLFRTEFSYMAREWWPTEDEEYATYRGVADGIGQTELHVRLVDFGAEKCPAFADIPVNRNPSLGLRGIRLLLQREDILRPQLLALARLARERPLTVLVPMLDALDTLEETLSACCRILGCASRAQFPFKLGCMIEVPAAALVVEQILPHCDALSIGLNDLTQYLLAADRDDEFVEKYHDACQPALLKLLHSVVGAAARHGKPVTVCGELAGDDSLTGLLLALGVRRLSVSQTSFRRVHERIGRISLRAIQGLDELLLGLTTARQVRQLLEQTFRGPA